MGLLSYVERERTIKRKMKNQERESSKLRNRKKWSVKECDKKRKEKILVRKKVFINKSKKLPKK